MLPEAPPDHSTISRTRRLIDLETHEAVLTRSALRTGVVFKTMDPAFTEVYPVGLASRKLSRARYRLRWARPRARPTAKRGPHALVVRSPLGGRGSVHLGGRGFGRSDCRRPVDRRHRPCRRRGVGPRRLRGAGDDRLPHGGHRRRGTFQFDVAAGRWEIEVTARDYTSAQDRRSKPGRRAWRRSRSS